MKGRQREAANPIRGHWIFPCRPQQEAIGEKERVRKGQKNVGEVREQGDERREKRKERRGEVRRQREKRGDMKRG